MRPRVIGWVVVWLLVVSVHLEAAFSFRKPITIDNTQVAGSADHSDFPVLVQILNDSDLRSAGNGGDVQSNSGFDIQFRAADGVSILDHEVESYDPVNGSINAWVRVPVLDFNDDTVLRLQCREPC